jgi:hypothetical protein
LQFLENGATMADDNISAKVRVLRPTKPELKLAPQGEEGCDPRLVDLVRLLAHRAARDWYEKQTKDGGGARF